MAPSVPNPIRSLVLWIDLALARLGQIEPERARRTTDLAWPRIVTGLARMSRSAVGVAMVGVGSAAIVFVFAEPIAVAFVGDPTGPAVPITVPLVYASCFAVVLQGISRGAAGPLKASDDTRWPFYSQLLGMFGCAIPLAYLGATTPLGHVGLYLAFSAETAVPAAIDYYRFSTGKWKAISRSYRPDAHPGDD